MLRREGRVLWEISGGGGDSLPSSFFKKPGDLIAGTLENPGPSLDVALDQPVRGCAEEVRDWHGREASRGLFMTAAMLLPTSMSSSLAKVILPSP
jgi:hypothetical protein